jgi:flagellar protein FliO/FliZ
MDGLDALRALGALLLVIGLLVGGLWVLRRFSGQLGVKPGATPSDLRVLEWRPIDPRRKLAVIRWDGRDHLLCLGPTGDCVVASRDAPAEAASVAPIKPPTGIAAKAVEILRGDAA